MWISFPHGPFSVLFPLFATTTKYGETPIVVLAQVQCILYVCLSELSDWWLNFISSVIHRPVTLLFVQYYDQYVRFLFCFCLELRHQLHHGLILPWIYFICFYSMPKLSEWWNRLTCSLNINRRTFSYLLLFHDIYYLAITLVNKHHARLCIKWPGLESAESELFRSVLWLSATRIPP